MSKPVPIATLVTTKDSFPIGFGCQPDKRMIQPDHIGKRKTNQLGHRIQAFCRHYLPAFRRVPQQTLQINPYQMTLIDLKFKVLEGFFRDD